MELLDHDFVKVVENFELLRGKQGEIKHLFFEVGESRLLLIWLYSASLCKRNYKWETKKSNTSCRERTERNRRQASRICWFLCYLTTYTNSAIDSYWKTYEDGVCIDSDQIGIQSDFVLC